MLACRATVESLGGYEHTVCLIASTAGEFRADCLGLASADRITAPLGLPRLALGALRSLLASRPPPRLVQCWSESLVPIARRVVPRDVPVLGPLRDLPFPEPKQPARAELRSLMDVGDGTPVIGILCDPPRCGDAHRIQYATGLFEICGLHAVAVIPAGAGSVPRGRRFHRETEVESRTFYSDYPSWACLPACDAAFLHTARNGPTAGVPSEAEDATDRGLTLMAHAAAVPVIVSRGPFGVATDAVGTSPSLRELATDACLAPSPRPADLARAMLVLLERGLPAVRRLGEELRSRALRSGERARRLAAVESAWRAAVRA